MGKKNSMRVKRKINWKWKKKEDREEGEGGGIGLLIAEFIIIHCKKIEKVFVFLMLLSLICIPFVEINYDLTAYLPDSVQSKAGIDLMTEEFGYPGTARVMIDDVNIYEAKEYKDRLEAVDGVDSVLWCDSMIDLTGPEEFIPYDEIKDYYKDRSAVMNVTFVEGDTSQRTSKAIDEMKAITGDKGYFVGMAVQNKSLAENVTSEMTMILGIAVVIIFLILCLTTTSWMEPILFLIVMMMAVVLNKGTDIFLGEISFLTNSVSAVLQLACSMDYSIFLLHAFTREKKKGLDQETALKNAVQEAISSILSSSLTTIVGFIVLVVMKFKIGFDMGIVLAKGIVLSLISVIFFMPAILLRMSKIIEKTSHRSFLPGFRRTSKFIYHCRGIVLMLVLLLAYPSYTAQTMNTFLYGNDAVGAAEGTQIYEDEQIINAKFGRSNMMMLILPNTSLVKEKEMAAELKELPYVQSVTSLADTMPVGIPEEFLPESLTGLLHTEDYARILLYVRSKGESELAYQASDEIMEILKSYYPQDSYLVGATPSTQDIETTITKDYSLVNVLSLIGVFFVVLLSFKSVTVPVLVMIPIEVAIFINMAIPYIKGEIMIYMGYIIVSCIQLGATVDYSILLTNNYISNRRNMEKKEAVLAALQMSIPAIITSGSILTSVGYILYGVSTISAIGDMGHLIGRGAALSMLLVTSVLPALLVCADQWVMSPLAQRMKQRKKALIEQLHAEGKENK